MFKRFYLSLVALLGLCGAVAVGNYTMTQGAGTSFGSVVIGGTVHYAQQLLCDLTTPAQCAAVSAGGAVKVDGSAVTQPVSLTSTTITGTVAATQSGTWTVQPGNTANTTAWLVNVGAINGVTPLMGNGATGTGSQRITLSNDNTIPTGWPTAANQTSQITQETAINTFLGVQADAVCGTATGTCTLAALVKFLNTAATAATPAGTNLIGDVNVRQGGTALSATNGGFQNILQGNAVLSATNGIFANILQGNAVLSATNPTFARSTDGIRSAIIDPCESNVQTFAPILMTTATTLRIIAPSASNKNYICSLFIKASAIDNVALVEGTGGSCVTGITGIIGGTTTSNGFVFGTAGDGVLLQSGGKTAIAQTAGTNVDTCLITSTTGPLIGGVRYVQAP